MALIRESLTTLKLYAWIFYIGIGIFSIVNQYDFIQEFGFDPLWDTAFIVLAFAYIVCGAYFVWNAKRLIPHYRAQIVRVITTLFAIEVVYGVFLFIAGFLYPSEFFPPEVTSDPNFLYWAIGPSVAGLLFSLLIYLFLVRAVNVVSGHTSPNGKPPMWLTISLWSILVLLIISPIVFLALVN